MLDHKEIHRHFKRADPVMAEVIKAVGPKGMHPEVIARFSVERLREAGVSRQKAGYLLDLGEKCRDGTVRLARLGRMTDEQVIEELVQVKGIGRWSAHMFLIFALG